MNARYTHYYVHYVYNRNFRYTGIEEEKKFIFVENKLKWREIIICHDTRANKTRVNATKMKYQRRRRKKSTNFVEKISLSQIEEIVNKHKNHSVLPEIQIISVERRVVISLHSNMFLISSRHRERTALVFTTIIQITPTKMTTMKKKKVILRLKMKRKKTPPAQIEKNLCGYLRKGKILRMKKMITTMERNKKLRYKILVRKLSSLHYTRRRPKT